MFLGSFVSLKMHEKQIIEVRRTCKVAEEKRASEAVVRYQSEKEVAVEEAVTKVRSESDSYVAKKVENIKERLREEARIDKEQAVTANLKIASVRFCLILEFC